MIIGNFKTADSSYTGTIKKDYTEALKPVGDGRCGGAKIRSTPCLASPIDGLWRGLISVPAENISG